MWNPIPNEQPNKSPESAFGTPTPRARGRDPALLCAGDGGPRSLPSRRPRDPAPPRTDPRPGEKHPADALAAAVQPYALAAASWALAATGGFGRTLLLILLTLLLIPILYVRGETAARGALALAHRLGGESGERTLRLAGQAIRGVALGVVLTALVQSVLAGVGLWMCGVPHAGLLAAFAFILGIAQVGPVLVLVPSVLWLYWIGNTGWATVLLMWSLPVGLLDNFLRPVLIRRGSH